jgi:hypothetical protein
MSKGWLKRFFTRFYGDEPGMLMPAVPERKEDDDLTAEQQRAAALLYQQGKQADEGADDDLDLPPPEANT